MAAQPRILIIGAGFSGLCLGIQLKKAGFHDFSILEKSDSLGGTWHENTYPGAACDSPSFVYCFSFEQKTDWSRKWALQPEILAYMEHCARKYELLSHIRFGTEVESARFSAETNQWQVRTQSGDELEAEILISGVGQLNRPYVPEIRGLDDFAGEQFHSARWNHDYDVQGKRVAVIGNAASAVQFVPEIAKQASQLYVFQRSANWMFPKPDREFRDDERQRFARHPWFARLYRWWIWALFELQFPVFRRNRLMGRRAARMAKDHLAETVTDPELRRVLTPNYPIGGKRILISNDYYKALVQDHVELVTDPIDHLSQDAVVTQSGRSIPVDAVILSTGFDTTRFLAPMHIEGLNGRVLEQEWKDGARAYLGITHAGFPNFFMTYGPNTNLGHNSIIFMLECQTHYIVECLKQMSREGVAAIHLREDVMEHYNRWIQQRLAGSIWATTGKSWYKTEDGKITNNWSGSTIEYWWKTRRPELSDYYRVR